MRAITITDGNDDEVVFKDDDEIKMIITMIMMKKVKMIMK